MIQKKPMKLSTQIALSKTNKDTQRNLGIFLFNPRQKRKVDMPTYTIVTTCGLVIVVHFNNLHELSDYMREQEIKPTLIKVN